MRKLFLLWQSEVRLMLAKSKNFISLVETSQFFVEYEENFGVTQVANFAGRGVRLWFGQDSPLQLKIGPILFEVPNVVAESGLPPIFYVLKTCFVPWQPLLEWIFTEAYICFRSCLIKIHGSCLVNNTLLFTFSINWAIVWLTLPFFLRDIFSENFIVNSSFKSWVPQGVTIKFDIL